MIDKPFALFKQHTQIQRHPKLNVSKRNCVMNLTQTLAESLLKFETKRTTNILGKDPRYQHECSTHLSNLSSIIHDISTRLMLNLKSLQQFKTEGTRSNCISSPARLQKNHDYVTTQNKNITFTKTSWKVVTE